MNYITLFWATLLSFFSAAVIGYVSLATPLGPWIGPTLALFSIIVFTPFFNRKEETLLAVCAGSMSGIMATAVSFAFPTLYFLDKSFFLSLLVHPVFFIGFLSSITCASSLFGWFCAQHAQKALLYEQDLAFPIGKLVYKIVNAQEREDKKEQLGWGLLLSLCYSLMQVTHFMGKYALPEKITLWNNVSYAGISIPSLRFDLTIAPMLISLGFIAGHMITIPLLVGTVTRIFFAEPVHAFLFPQLGLIDFTFAFCAGIVLSGVAAGFSRMQQELYQLTRGWYHRTRKRFKNKSIMQSITPRSLAIFFIVICLFSVLHFSIFSQAYLLATGALCSYQIAQIAGKIGLALLGRFATFVLIPGLLVFRFNALQITVVTTFIELAGGVAAETLFGLKAFQLGSVDPEKGRFYQLFGIIVGSIAVAGVFYFLVKRFELGSPELFAQRGQARALLVQAASFDYHVLAVGVLFGLLLKKIKVHPMLVLGGLLMPLSLSLSLIGGGCISYVVQNKQEYEPLCSGIYAANALTMLLSVLV